MGPFSTVIHPNTGEAIQFKTGCDYCGEYHVVGKTDLPDGVYESSGMSFCKVVIVNGRILAVEDIKFDFDYLKKDNN
jgi:hypothetical protein